MSGIILRRGPRQPKAARSHVCEPPDWETQPLGTIWRCDECQRRWKVTLIDRQPLAYVDWTRYIWPWPR